MTRGKTKAALASRCKELGARMFWDTFDDWIDVCIAAPKGHKWCASGTHSLVTEELREKGATPRLVAYLFDNIDDGLEACDCDECALDASGEFE